MNRMLFNRLWFQLSVAFGSVVIIAAIMFAVVTFLLRPERPEDLVPPNEDARAEFRPRAQRFITQSFITIAITGGVLGIAAGVWLSRRMTAPLDELTKGAQAIGARELDYRVPERGSVEVITLAQSFNQMADDLREGERKRQNLLADVAHELRTPLTVLQGNLRALLDDVYELDKAEVARLYDQTRHLNALVNDLHELAQAEAQQLPLLRTPTDIVPLVQTATEMVEPLAEAEGIQLTIDVPETPLLIEADQARLMQVLQNLLSNALRHTPAAGSIMARVTRQDEDVLIAVCDTGEGIDSAHLPHVFDRFYRADHARDRDSGGAGLGLAIVRALVEVHGGSVSVASAGLGLGSTFTIMLPALKNEHEVT